MTAITGILVRARRDIIVVEVAEAFLFAIPYGVLADVVLVVHLVWILWVILGVLLTRHRPPLAGLHILSLVYGIVIEVGPWACPLTLAEQWLESKAGLTPYTGSFVAHYLEALVYPNVSQSFRVWVLQPWPRATWAYMESVSAEVGNRLAPAGKADPRGCSEALQANLRRRRFTLSAEAMPILVLGTMNHPDSSTYAQLDAMGVLGARIPPGTVSIWYRLGLAMGAALAGLFPLAYVALVAIATWSVCSVALRHWVVLGATSGFYSPAGCCAFLAAGCLMVLSLLKPLVARPGHTAEMHFLDPAKEPLLFAFVSELASRCGIPQPSRIAVDCSVNCCCVFSGGIGGIFRSDLVLLVGLPLAAGLRLAEFGGVLAHELAHAAQTKAMRPSRVIWSVHAWFSRVAHEQDEIDEQFLKWLGTAGSATRPVLRLAQVLSKLGRGVLRLLMVAESSVNSVSLRRMEVEADRYQARVAGTDAFVSTVLDINLLALAAQRSVVELSRMKRQGQLVDNYPGLIVGLRELYSKQFVQRVLSGIEEGEAGWFSAHPGDKDRIALGRAEKRQGILTAGLPAAILFTEYDALCRAVTLEFYDRELRLDRGSCELIPLQNLLRELE